MNYCDDLLRACAAAPKKRLAVELDTGSEISFEELLERVRQLAGVLRKRGVGPGRAVAIHLYNSIDAIVVHMAVQWLGACSCFVDALVQPKALGYYVEVTESVLLVTRCKRDELTDDVLGQTGVLFADELPDCAMNQPSDTSLPYPWKSDETCYVYFTSGTTSQPKGVMLTPANHQNFTKICTRYWQPVTDSSRHICYVPFSHGFGTIFLVPCCEPSIPSKSSMRSDATA